MNIWPLKQSLFRFSFIYFFNGYSFSFCFICRHIEEDLQAQQIPTPKSVDEMSDEEKSYFFFKVHDLDGNDKLDGLEIFYSATHHSESTNSESHHHHEHEEKTETDPAIQDNNEIDKSNEKTHERETDEQPSDSTQNSSAINLKLLEIKANDDGSGNKNLNHIIGRLKKVNKSLFLSKELF